MGDGSSPLSLSDRRRRTRRFHQTSTPAFLGRRIWVHKKSLLDLAAKQGLNGGWEFATLSFRSEKEDEEVPSNLHSSIPWKEDLGTQEVPARPCGQTGTKWGMGVRHSLFQIGEGGRGGSIKPPLQHSLEGGFGYTRSPCSTLRPNRD